MVGIVTLLLLLPALASAGPPARSAPRAAASFTLSQQGRSPTAIGLEWTAASDLLFAGYTLYESTSGSAGPWSV
ncbi:MAG: hypothetical protein L3J91_06545, partial [Thermoplasmata archaeon]|nr:hypothetical protein [Thermoplasmata archaeon]